MTLNDPRRIIPLLGDLTSEINYWSLTASETLKEAEYNQKMAQERIQQGFHYGNIIVNKVVDDQENIYEVKAECIQLLNDCENAVELSHNLLQKTQQAQQIANDVLKHWHNELQLALAWLERAKARLERAIREYELARENVASCQDRYRSAQSEVRSAESNLQSCLRDPEKKGNCSYERNRVQRAYEKLQEAEYQLQSAIQLLQLAEIELHEAEAEFKRAQARVNCCKNAVNYATQAVETANQAYQDANDALIHAERSLEQSKVGEKFINKAEELNQQAQENSEQMMVNIRHAETATTQAQNIYHNADGVYDSAQRYAKLGTQEINHRRDLLILFNRPSGFNAPVSGTVSSSVNPQSQSNLSSSPSSSMTNSNHSDPTEEEKSNLITELQQLRIKCTPEKIIRIAKNQSGKIIFLESGKAGNKGSGLQHILENHLQDFLNRGISQAQISEVIMKAITEGKARGTQGKSRTIYEVEFNRIIHYISIEVSNNGYIVGANPTPQRLINKLKGVNEYGN